MLGIGLITDLIGQINYLIWVIVTHFGVIALLREI